MGMGRVGYFGGNWIVFQVWQVVVCFVFPSWFGSGDCCSLLLESGKEGGTPVLVVLVDHAYRGVRDVG